MSLIFFKIVYLYTTLFLFTIKKSIIFFNGEYIIGKIDINNSTIYLFVVNNFNFGLFSNNLIFVITFLTICRIAYNRYAASKLK